MRRYSTDRGEFGTIMSFEDFCGKKDAGKGKTESCSFLICVVLCIFLSFFLYVVFLSVSGEDFGVVLESRINPNEATAASLLRLPGIGRSRAESIVSYRESLRGENTKFRAFSRCADLENVKGIGPKTAENICEWLKFD